MPSSKRPLNFPESLTALATPFEHDDIAEKAFADLVAWQIEQGSEGLVVGGVTGEASTLFPKERRPPDRDSGRNGVAPRSDCRGDRNELHARDHRAHAGGGGGWSDGGSIVTPYYNKPNQEGLYRHYREVANSVGIPLILENDPVEDLRGNSSGNTGEAGGDAEYRRH